VQKVALERVYRRQERDALSEEKVFTKELKQAKEIKNLSQEV
jgi:hypothetical protein